MSLHKSEWTSKVSSAALASLKHRRYNDPDILPLTSDLVKLRSHMTQQISNLTEELKQKPSSATYRSLSEVTYTRLVVFNKRRRGETAKLLMEAVQHRPRWEETAQDETVNTLKPIEKQLLRRLVLEMGKNPQCLGSVLFGFYDCHGSGSGSCQVFKTGSSSVRVL